MSGGDFATEAVARRAIVEVCRRMWTRQYISAADGNVSVRLASGEILVTPTALSKGFLADADIVKVNARGERLDGRHGASSELLMHLCAYVERADVGAVVHAHPATVVGLSVAGASLSHFVVPEAAVVLGAVPTVAYERPGTARFADVLRAPLRDHDVVVLERHGCLTLGRTLEQAYDRLETLEHTAVVTARAHAAGGSVRSLAAEEVRALLAAAGMEPARIERVLAGACRGCPICR